MSDLSPIPPTWQDQQDREHLRLLSIFYFISAGLSAIGLFIGLVYMVLGVILGLASAGDGEGLILGVVFAGVGVFIVLTSAVWIVCQVLAGYYLSQRRNEIFCMVIAALSCTSFPVGTALGVFTFIVLARPSVKGLFEPTKTGNRDDASPTLPA